MSKLVHYKLKLPILKTFLAFLLDTVIAKFCFMT